VWATVVGIVRDARTESLAAAATPHIYMSLYQRQGKHLAIFVRGKTELSGIERQVREQVQAINSALPVFGARTLDDAVSASLAMRRFTLRLIAAFAVCALLLAALGLYGVISYMVGERLHEIGLRVALGATSADVMRMVMRQGLSLVVAGGAVGLAGAVLVSRAMHGLLVDVSPTDPLTLVAATALLTIVAVLGCLAPARRAVRVDPIVALR
jgi:putative ABC transport system permease protein